MGSVIGETKFKEHKKAKTDGNSQKFRNKLQKQIFILKTVTKEHYNP